MLDGLIELAAECRLIPLLGNHDGMMLQARDDLMRFDEWLAAGGRQTLRSYGASEDWQQFAGGIPEAHWQFLAERCVPFYENETHFFVHANAEADLPLADQPDYMRYWERLSPATWRPHESGKTMVCGHSSQRSGRPLELEQAVCIDTWAYGDGWLTCLEVAAQLYWQANQRGETRVGNLGFRGRDS